MHSAPVSRLVVATLAVSTLPAFLVVDTALAWAAGWRTSNALPRVFVALAIGTAVFLCAMLSRPAGRQWLASRAPRLAVLTASIALFWGLAEWTAGLRSGEVESSCAGCRTTEGTHGGCRASAYAHHGRWTAPDPYCDHGEQECDLRELRERAAEQSA